MPYDCLKRFSVRSHRIPVHHGHEYASVRHFCGVPTVSPDNAADSSSDFLGILKGFNKIATDITVRVSTAHREDEDHIVGAKAAATKPLSVGGLPTLVIYSSGQFGDIIRGRVSLDAGNFPEIVHR